MVLTELGQLQALAFRIVVLDCLEFGQDLEITWTTRGSFDPNQPLQIEAQNLHPEQLECDGMWLQIFVGASARDLAEQIEVAEIGSQGEIETTVDGLGVPAKRQAVWSAA